MTGRPDAGAQQAARGTNPSLPRRAQRRATRELCLVVGLLLIGAGLIAPRATAAPGDISTFAGGPGYGPAVTVGQVPAGVDAGVVDGEMTIFVADRVNNVVRAINPAGDETVVAGIGIPGYSGDGGPAVKAEMNGPSGVALDGPRRKLYVVETEGERVRVIDLAARPPVISLVAGDGTFGFSGDGGPSSEAQLWFPTDVALDSTANRLFVADSSNRRVRAIDLSADPPSISTFAGGGQAACDACPPTAATLGYVQAVDVDSAGNLILSDVTSVRRVSSGLMRTVAGAVIAVGATTADGSSLQANIEAWGVADDGAGGIIFSDRTKPRVRRIDIDALTITTLAGDGIIGWRDGPAAQARFSVPGDVAVIGDHIFVGDVKNRRLRQVAGGNVTTLAGNGTGHYGGDGRTAPSAQLTYPGQIAADAAGDVFVAEGGDFHSGNAARVRRVAPDGTISTVAGGGDDVGCGDFVPCVAATALIDPATVAADRDGRTVYVGSDSRVRRVDVTASPPLMVTIAGTGAASGPLGDGGPARSATLRLVNGLALDSAANVLFVNDGDRVRRVDLGADPPTITSVAGGGVDDACGDGGPCPAAQVHLAGSGMALRGSELFIADRTRVRRIDLASVPATVQTVAGTGVPGDSGDGGPATAANLQMADSVAFDLGGDLLVVDRDAFRLRAVDAATGQIHTLAGTGENGFTAGGPAAAARLGSPSGVAVLGSDVLVSEIENHLVRRIEGAAGGGGSTHSTTPSSTPLSTTTSSEPPTTSSTTTTRPLVTLPPETAPTLPTTSSSVAPPPPPPPPTTLEPTTTSLVTSTPSSTTTTTPRFRPRPTTTTDTRDVDPVPTTVGRVTSTPSNDSSPDATSTSVPEMTTSHPSPKSPFGGGGPGGGPQVDVSPRSADSGGGVRVGGIGFPVGAMLDISAGGSLVGRTVADQTGRFGATVNMPRSARPGPMKVVVSAPGAAGAPAASEVVLIDRPDGRALSLRTVSDAVPAPTSPLNTVLILFGLLVLAVGYSTGHEAGRRR